MADRANATRIDQAYGERWFRSEAEARAAAWARQALKGSARLKPGKCRLDAPSKAHKQ